MGQFERDIAFSFFEPDLSLVRQIEERLEGRFSTFTYVDHQPKLVGTNGHETLSRVFEDECCTSIILFRNGWGEQGFTVPEKTGILNRGHREGWDFLLVVVLDEGVPELPKFIPKTTIWYGFKRFGIEGLLPVIDAHVARNGGEPSEATVEGKMAAAKRAQQLEEDRRRYRLMRVGPDLRHPWVADGRRFQELLMEKAKATKAMTLTCEGELGNVVRVLGPGAFLATTFRPDRESWFMWCGFHTTTGDPYGRGDTRSVEELICYPDLDPDSQPAWRVGDRHLRSEHLVDFVLGKLADHMRPSR